MNARCVWVILTVALSIPAQAEILPTGGIADSRVRSAPYRGDEVYRLHGFVGYEIELVFEEGENFIAHAGGDLQGLEVAAYRNHVVLKPSAAAVVTNLVVFSDRRTYRFHYSAAARRPNPEIDQVMYAVQFTYPPRASSAGDRQAAQIEQRLKQGSKRTVNRDYWYCGHPALEPSAASDDGVQTRLQFGLRKEWPTVFVRNDDGTESLLNFNVEQGEMVIHRIARQLLLRRGRLTGCVVNRGYGGTGEHLKSGTVVPGVERHTKGGRQ